MNPETQQSESPYCVKIETETGQSVTVPIAVLTPSQLEILLQSEFKKLAQEAGVKGVRIHVERAIAADYEQVLREVTACLSSAKAHAA
jgi:ABC-type Fe3+-hydroxamate transport system substrate-binding protein